MTELLRTMQFIKSNLWSFVLLIMCYEVEFVISAMSNSTSEGMQLTTKNGVPICSTNKLAIQGYDVEISQVLNAKCFGKVKFIEVFALNKLYIDADFETTEQKVQLSLIAPVWVIIGNRKIILNGKAGAEHASPYAPDGIGSFRHGRPGKPGELE